MARKAVSPIEALLGFEFVSDPSKAKYPLPETPKEHLKTRPDRPFPHPGMVITPEMARDILKHRVIRVDLIPRQRRHEDITRNRRFLMGSLQGTKRNKGLIRIVQDGELNPRTSIPLVFTEDGYLLDGQHRIAACWLSKKSIEYPVTTNGQWDTFSVLDTGRSRRPDQLLGEGIPYPEQAAAVAKLIISVLRGTEQNEWTAQDASNQDIYELVRGWPFFYGDEDGSDSWLKHVAKASKSRIPITALGASTIMALAAGANPDHVQEFLNGLTPGYRDGFPMLGKNGEDPRHLLRRQYLNKQQSKHPNDKERRIQVSHVRRAMEVWLEYKAYMDPKDEGKLIELTKFQGPSESSSLPAVWRADAVRSFHEKAVS